MSKLDPQVEREILDVLDDMQAMSDAFTGDRNEDVPEEKLAPIRARLLVAIEKCPPELAVRFKEIAHKLLEAP